MVVKSKCHQKSIEEVIDQGAHVIEDRVRVSNDWTLISVRLPKEMLKIIDEARSKSVGLSRNAWILQQLQNALDQ